jgi:hypothetical protein
MRNRPDDVCSRCKGLLYPSALASADIRIPAMVDLFCPNCGCMYASTGTLPRLSVVPPPGMPEEDDEELSLYSIVMTMGLQAAGLPERSSRRHWRSRGPSRNERHG